MFSIIIPVYNEQGNIIPLFKKLQKTFPAPHEIIVINDGSTDKTAEDLKKIKCRTINLPVNKGKGNAVRIGIAAATGTHLGLIDGDGQDRPQDLLRLFHVAQKTHADLVLGSRFLDTNKLAKAAVLPINYIGNTIVTFLFNLLFQTKISDACASLRVFRTAQVKKMPIISQRYEIELEMLIRAIRNRYRIKEIPVARYARRRGKSNLYEIPFGRIRFGVRALAIMGKGFLLWR
jgi:glycosyltransferase involved in cell wall biosynthesis